MQIRLGRRKEIVTQLVPGLNAKSRKTSVGNSLSSVHDELIFKFHTLRDINKIFNLIVMQSPMNWMAHAWLLSKSQTALSKGKAGEKRRFEKSPFED